MPLNIKATNVFRRNKEAYDSDKRYIINQGGSRSSKTYSILQLLIVICLTRRNTSVSIIRKSFPSLRGSVLRDFIEIMNQLEIYQVNNHNKTEHKYRFDNGSFIEFFSIDDAQRVRGRKRDICYCNEANELTYEDFQQLSLRTNLSYFIDFNPSDTEHWIYDLIKDDRSILIKSTYKDNNYLPQSLVNEIESLIDRDQNFYRIYALGEIPFAQSKVYTHFKQYVDTPEYTDWCYGLDFGYTHPCVLVKIMYSQDKIYIEELLYKSNLTTSDIINELKTLIIDNKPIYCDSAAPATIEELKRNRFNAVSSNKSVKEGIDEVRRNNIYINIESVNLWKEYKLYSFKTNGDVILEDVIKLNDDGMDALRYAIFTNKKKKVDPRILKIY